MRNLTRSMVCALCLAPMVAKAAPGWTEIDPEPLIAQCWAISQEDRDSGVTVRMVEGAAKSVDCLEEEIVRHATPFFKTRTEAEIRKMILDLDRSYAEFYWVMHNENEGCDPSCGSINHTSHLGALAALLEDMLRDLAAQRNFYER